MGSYALSQNTSSTANINAPIAQENVSNPINLSNSAGVRLGSNDIKNDIRGSTVNTLDGGAIQKAFDFAEKTIEQSVALSKQINQSVADVSLKSNEVVAKSTDALNKAIERNANPDSLIEFLQNKTLLIAVVVIAGIYLWKGH